MHHQKPTETNRNFRNQQKPSENQMWMIPSENQMWMIPSENHQKPYAPSETLCTIRNLMHHQRTKCG